MFRKFFTLSCMVLLYTSTYTVVFAFYYVFRVHTDENFFYPTPLACAAIGFLALFLFDAILDVITTSPAEIKKILKLLIQKIKSQLLKPIRYVAYCFYHFVLRLENISEKMTHVYAEK